LVTFKKGGNQLGTVKLFYLSIIEMFQFAGTIWILGFHKMTPICYVDADASKARTVELGTLGARGSQNYTSLALHGNRVRTLSSSL